MPRGHVTALFLFDIADAIDLDAVRRQVAAAPAALSTKPAAPAYLQYAQPPIVIDGATIGTAEAHGFRVRFKTFDYGVVSVALTRPLPTAWPDLLEAGIGWHDSGLLIADAEALCRRVAVVAGGRLAASGRLTDILAFEVHGWELVVSNLKPEVLERVTPAVRRVVEISPGRYTLELALDPPPERLLSDLIATGATLVSLNPLRETLEDFFVRRVAEAGTGARPALPSQEADARR